MNEDYGSGNRGFMLTGLEGVEHTLKELAEGQSDIQAKLKRLHQDMGGLHDDVHSLQQGITRLFTARPSQSRMNTMPADLPDKAPGTSLDTTFGAPTPGESRTHLDHFNVDNGGHLFAKFPTGGSSEDVKSKASITSRPNWPGSIKPRKFETNGDAAISIKEAVRVLTRKGHRQRDFEFGIAHSLFVLEPGSMGRVVVDTVSILMLVYDMIVMPTVLAWDLPFDGVVMYGACVTLVFWTFDILVNFRTGYYYSGGEVEMSPTRIALHYLKTFFLPDLIILVSEWLSVMILLRGEGDKMTTGSKLLRVGKVGRLLRIVGAFRLVRLSAIHARLAEWSYLFSWIRAALEFSTPLFMLIWLNHVISCVWFAIGLMGESDTGRSWLDEYIGEDGHLTYRESGAWFQYLTAMHWSLTQMTPGSMQIAAYNSTERAYNNLCLIIGLLSCGYLVSLISGKIARIQAQKAEEIRSLGALRKFLHQKHISLALSIKMQKQAKDRLATKRQMGHKQDKVLELISKSLQMELRYELCQSSLLLHPLFSLWAWADGYSLRRALLNFVSFESMQTGDDVFLAGSLATHAWIVIDGSLLYMQNPESSRVQEKSTDVAKPGDWIAEAALWCNWIHVGSAQVLETTELLCVDVAKFCDEVRGTRLIATMASEYSRTFHARLNSPTTFMQSWPTDLKVPLASHVEIVASLGRDMRMLIGLMAVSHLANKRVQKHGKLEKEVLSGQCVLWLSTEGKIERVVAITTLSLTRQDGRVLAKLGKWDPETGVEPACKLPGTKLREGEFPEAAFSRLMKEELSFIEGRISVETIDCTEKWESSKKYNVRTKYLKSCHSASLIVPPCSTSIAEVEVKHDDCMVSLESELPEVKPDDRRASGRKDRPRLSTVLHRVLEWEVFAVRRGLPLGSAGDQPPGLLRRSSFESMQDSQDSKSESITLYGWLTVDELQELSEKQSLGGVKMKQWLQSLLLDEDLANRVEQARAESRRAKVTCV